MQSARHQSNKNHIRSATQILIACYGRLMCRPDYGPAALRHLGVWVRNARMYRIALTEPRCVNPIHLDTRSPAGAGQRWPSPSPPRLAWADILSVQALRPVWDHAQGCSECSRRSTPIAVLVQSLPAANSVWACGVVADAV